MRLNRLSQTHQDGTEAVTLARGFNQVPEVPLLALADPWCPQDTLFLHVNHHGMDGALVALGIQSHCQHDAGAGAGTLGGDGGADAGADGAGE